MLLNIHMNIAEGLGCTAQQAANEFLDALDRACMGNKREVWLPPGSSIEVSKWPRRSLWRCSHDTHDGGPASPGRRHH